MSIIVTIRNSSQAWDLVRDTYELRGWTYEAFCELFDYMNERSLGEPWEFDPVAWVREYSTWKTATACCEGRYKINYAELVEKNENENGDEDSLEQLCLDFLADHTSIVYNDLNGLVIANF